MMLPIVGVLIGIAIGIMSPVSMPVEYGKFLAAYVLLWKKNSITPYLSVGFL